MDLDQYPNLGFLLQFLVIIIFLWSQFQLLSNRYLNQIILQLLAKEIICVLWFLIFHMKSILWNVGSVLHAFGFILWQFPSIVFYLHVHIPLLLQKKKRKKEKRQQHDELNSETRLPEFESQLCHLLVIGLRASDLAPLWLSFHISMMRTIRAPTS